jgi:hypothetical protein
MADTRMMSELDAQTIRNNAAREAWGLNQQSSQLVEQARQAERAGRLAAGATLLGGLGNAAGMSYQAGWITSPTTGRTGKTGGQLVDDVWGAGNMAAFDRYARRR